MCCVGFFFRSANISSQYNIFYHVWYHLTRHLQVDERVTHAETLGILNHACVLWGGRWHFPGMSRVPEMMDWLLDGWSAQARVKQTEQDGDRWCTNRGQKTGKLEFMGREFGAVMKIHGFFSSGHLSPLQREAAAEYRCRHVSLEAAAMKISDQWYIVIVELLKQKIPCIMYKSSFSEPDAWSRHRMKCSRCLQHEQNFQIPSHKR